MIHPDMATMLAFVMTDARATPEFLKSALREAADSSFHAISVDGDTSTNDTVLLMASGKLEGERLSRPSQGIEFRRGGLRWRPGGAGAGCRGGGGGPGGAGPCGGAARRAGTGRPGGQHGRACR